MKRQTKNKLEEEMTSPKKALEYAHESLQHILVNVPSSAFPYGSLSAYKRARRNAKAAIPVAELHEQAVELLISYHKFKGLEEWDKKRIALLARVEALK